MNDLMDDDETMKSKKQKQSSDSSTPVLDNFSRDLNKLAEQGKLDPVIGRDREILRIAQILSRRKKNNPIIVGEPGCGKTALVEGLAIKIVNGECPRNLVDKRIVNLDLTSVVAGTKYRGQFEERMKVIIEELQANPNILEQPLSMSSVRTLRRMEHWNVDFKRFWLNLHQLRRQSKSSRMFETNMNLIIRFHIRMRLSKRVLTSLTDISPTVNSLIRHSTSWMKLELVCRPNLKFHL